MRKILMILTDTNFSIPRAKWDTLVELIHDEVTRAAYRVDMSSKGQSASLRPKHCWLFTMEDLASELKLHDNLGPLLRHHRVPEALTWAVVGDFGYVS